MEKEQVTANVPALIMSGDFTTDVPPEWGDLAASSFSPAYHAKFSMAGPFLIATNAYRDCSNRILSAFLADPTAKLDFACATAKKTFPWITLS